MGDAIRHKSGHVLDEDRCLAELREQLLQSFNSPLRSMQSANRFDGWLQMDGIHQVDTDHILWALGNAAYLGDGNARGVGPKTDCRGHCAVEIRVDVLLDAPVLGHILDYKAANSDICQLR